VGFTFNASAAQGQLKDLQRAIQDALPAAVDAGANAVLEEPPPYGGPGEFVGGEQTIPTRDLRSSVYRRGTTAAVDIAVVYDWVLSPFAHHCSDASGLDCPTIARGGPYTARTLPAIPRDGTTPCGADCGCQLVVRDPPWIGDPSVFIDTATAAVDAGIGGRS
jgi:hypothetical protein